MVHAGVVEDLYNTVNLNTRFRSLPHFSASSSYTTSLFVISTIAASLFLFLLSLAIQHLKRNTYKSSPRGRWTQLSDMEKATTSSTSKSSSSTSPPPASACDVLKPLSQNSNFPSSGAVAARAREQMQNSGKSSPSSATVATQNGSGSEGGNPATGSVQKRNESVQQMREVDANGVRTWRRLVVEYS